MALLRGLSRLLFPTALAAASACEPSTSTTEGSATEASATEASATKGSTTEMTASSGASESTDTAMTATESGSTTVADSESTGTDSESTGETTDACGDAEQESPQAQRLGIAVGTPDQGPAQHGGDGDRHDQGGVDHPRPVLALRLWGIRFHPTRRGGLASATLHAE